MKRGKKMKTRKKIIDILCQDPKSRKREMYEPISTYSSEAETKESLWEKIKRFFNTLSKIIGSIKNLATILNSITNFIKLIFTLTGKGCFA